MIEKNEISFEQKHSEVNKGSLEYVDRHLKSANDWDSKKEDLEKEIKVPIYFYIDNKGNKVYDVEEMANIFEQKLNNIVTGSTVICSIKED